MISKNELKYIQSLCHKKQRNESGLFVAEGPKIVDELLTGGYTVKKIFALPDWKPAHALPKGLDITEVTEVELERMSSLQTPNNVLAVAEQRTPSAFTYKGKVTLMLDGIQDPGNLGTIIRIADWFGITQVVCSNDTAELYNPKVIQSTMGSFVRVDVLYADIAEAVIAAAKVPVYGALLDGKSLYTMEPVKEGIILIGNEGRGIREQHQPLVTQPVTIPRIGGAESLNAAVATGIIVSHLIGKAK